MTDMSMERSGPGWLAMASAARWSRGFILAFHAALAGAFTVAWFTGDEDTYRIHLLAGYVVASALVTRGALMLAGNRPPLRIKLATRRDVVEWAGAVARLDRRALGRRGPLHGWTVIAVLLATAGAAVTGLLADAWSMVEDAHEVVANIALWAVLAHLAHLALMTGFKWLNRRLAVAPLVLVGLVLAPLMMAGTPSPALAAGTGDPARDAILAGYLAQAKAADPAFAGFSATRGRALYLGAHTGGKNDTPACATCHTPDPTRVGRNAKTGRDIEPMAAWITPKRFTNAADVEKRFSRDCPNVLGRECTAAERGDFLTYLSTP